MKNIIITVVLVGLLGCNTKEQIVNMNKDKNEKYIIYKGHFWNHPLELWECTRDEIANKHLDKEGRMLSNPGTLNFLANENMIKHKELVNYLQNELGERIDFRLNGQPFILADYKLTNPLSIRNVEEILKISEFSMYKIIDLNEELEGKYIILISEDYGFESESNKLDDYVFSSHFDAEIGVTNFLISQISSLYANFIRIKEDKSKTDEFKSFMSSLTYFRFDEGYLIIQPKNELTQNIEQYTIEELIRVKSEIDVILNYTNSVVYEIVKM